MEGTLVAKNNIPPKNKKKKEHKKITLNFLVIYNGSILKYFLF